MRPADAVEAAVEPGPRGERGFELGAGDQIFVEREERGRDADADQDQPLALDAAPGRQPVDEAGGQEPTDDGEGGDATAGLAEHENAEQRACRRPGGRADHVGAGQRIAADRLEDRAGDAEAGARRDAGGQPWEPEADDDERGGGVAVAGQCG